MRRVIVVDDIGHAQVTHGPTVKTVGDSVRTVPVASPKPTVMLWHYEYVDVAFEDKNQ